MDAIFVPCLSADVNVAGERQLFPRYVVIDCSSWRS
jgi:hypothetical protein